MADRRHVVKPDDGRRRGNTSRRPIVVNVGLKWYELPDELVTQLFTHIGDEPYTEDMLRGRVHYTTIVTIKE